MSFLISEVILLPIPFTDLTRLFGGWSHADGKDEKGERFVTALEIPPVESPQTAVKVAIVAEARGKAIICDFVFCDNCCCWVSSDTHVFFRPKQASIAKNRNHFGLVNCGSNL